MPLKTIIVEDEIASRNNLRQLLKAVGNDEIQLLAEAESVGEAVDTILKLQPELIFLDIQLIGGSGFDVLDQILGEVECKVIFVTSYDEYAIRAIRYSALDYLLKPIDIDDLQAAVQRANQPDSGAPSLRKINPGNSISIPTTEGTIILPIAEIIYCEAKGSYSSIHLRNERPLLVSQNLRHLEGQLPREQFFRIHRSYLVNLQEVSRLGSKENGTIDLRSGVTLPVSRRRRPELARFF